MSVEQSEKIVTELIPASIAFSMPLRRASDSAMRGELTDSTIWDPDLGGCDRSLERHQVSPSRFDEASQEASTAQDGRVDDVAADRPFVVVSLGRFVLSSKISLFLANQMVQQIHRRIGDRIPVGGRQSACLKA
ncbi:hypothetical protein YC2023_039919 [Brassica napus]|nr:unnamed protein product [Brassica oleracea]